jgi:hypothetical protein
MAKEIVELPNKNSDFPLLCGCLPEGTPILKPPAIGVSIKVTTAVESGKQNAVIMGRWGTRWDQFGQWVTTMGHLRDDRNL